MDYTGSWSFIICGNQLDFEEIKEKIKLIPTRVTRKGDIKSKVTGVSQYDIWIYEQKFVSRSEIMESMENLLKILKPSQEYIHEIANKFNVAMRCYIQSDLAQVGMIIPSRMVVELATMDLNLEISIFSWGGVSDV